MNSHNRAATRALVASRDSECSEQRREALVMAAERHRALAASCVEARRLYREANPVQMANRHTKIVVEAQRRASRISADAEWLARAVDAAGCQYI
jgi:tellurite resistance protein